MTVFKFSILKIFLIWYLSIISIFLIGFNFFPKNSTAYSTFFNNFANWDGKHFLDVAENGYLFFNNTPFFPLYPILIKLLTFITQSYLASALIISAVSFYLALIFLYKLAALEFNKQIAKKAIFYILIFPTSFYFITAYSESLFLLLTVLSFYFFKRSLMADAGKKEIWLASFFAVLSSLTRFVGIAVCLGLIIDVLWKKKSFKKSWPIFLSPIGTVAYCIYIYFLTGDPFYYSKVESFWGRFVDYPWMSFVRSYYTIAYTNVNYDYLSRVIELLFTILGLGLAVRSFRFLPKKYSFYALISLLIPISTSTLLSIPRFILPIFPFYILIALIKRPLANYVYIFISTTLLIVFSILFINGYWVS